ncbi:MAG: hypothetical protein E6R13_00910 [Spirochaetes bacterium]|nr:MAG: hypothetical protein E6R13_00910 [Spirochaetota bacterium]
MDSFIIQGRKNMNKYVVKSINDLLKVLNSPIVFPTDRKGNIQENKVLQVVKSREQVYLSTVNMIALIEIDSELFLKSIVKGLKNTWTELTKIITRDIGANDNEDDEEVEIDDTLLSNISQAKELASKLAFKILERIELLQMTDIEKKENIEKSLSVSTIEKYAENR